MPFGGGNRHSAPTRVRRATHGGQRTRLQYDPRHSHRAEHLRRSFDRDILTANVRRIRFHDMRHTCASLLLAEGVQMRVVMEVLGHANMAITSDIYSHVAPTTLRRPRKR
ncbi:tyrosine-type recombinase/integrase [Plantibacter sp. RU18]|uniref:tyrosine-type recombinase/integrase n=1 Tax=Plantibacter sp. RU18 TaxID=3158143 RepID=UPI002BC4C1A5|nr:tyrosine-type recombinase/integrase [Gemmatimonadaceae bacterium]